MIRYALPLLCLACLLPVFPAAAAPAPTDASANLDADCEPDDVMDRLREMLMPQRFWRQERDLLQSIARGARMRLQQSEELYRSNRGERSQFEQELRAKLAEKNLDREDSNRLYHESMSTYDGWARASQRSMGQARAELEWAERCLDKARRLAR